MSTRRTIAVLGAAAVLATASCATEVGDKAGGTVQTVTLRFGNTNSWMEFTPQVKAYVDAVERVSSGAIQVEVLDEWRDFAPGFEQGTISDVAAGKVDLAWVGTRAFDLVGATAFQALTAPMLIDSYALQKAVSDSDIPESMLAELDVDGVEGLAVLAGGLRKPLSVDKPWVSLADFRGKTFASFQSGLATAATRALGATPDNTVIADDLRRGLATGTIDGIERQLSTVAIQGYQKEAPYVAANVNLWPETIAIIANAERLGSLTEQQRAWLAEAAKDATSKGVEVLRDEAEDLAILCSYGLRAGQASKVQLAEFRAAFDDLYESLRADPATADFIDRIEELKARTSTDETLVVPPECTGEAQAPTSAPSASAGPADEARALEGVYRWTLTAEAAAAAHHPGSPGYPWPWAFTMTLKDGRWSHRVRDPKNDADYGGGPYTVKGDLLTLRWDSGGSMSFTFRADDAGNLTLEPGPRNTLDDAFVMASQPWVRVD